MRIVLGGFSYSVKLNFGNFKTTNNRLKQHKKHQGMVVDLCLPDHPTLTMEADQAKGQSWPFANLVHL